MGEFGKILRWSAPGAVAIAGAVVLVVVGRLVAALSTGSGCARACGAVLNVSGGFVALLAAVTVPAGFIIYQAYFHMSRRRSLLFAYVHADVGGDVLESSGHAAARRVGGLELTQRRGLYLRPWPNRRVWGSTLWAPPTAWFKNGADLRPAVSHETVSQYYENRKQHWTTVDIALELALQGPPGRLSATLDRLADLYHTLGATRYAVVAAWIAGTGWLASTTTGSWEVRLAVAAVVVVAAVGYFLVWRTIHLNRADCQERRRALMIAVLSR